LSFLKGTSQVEKLFFKKKIEVDNSKYKSFNDLVINDNVGKGFSVPCRFSL